jgi:sterol carrier protein 2
LLSVMIASVLMKCNSTSNWRANSRVCIDALGLSPPGKAHELIANGDITFGGKYVINPSGGLISKGHPIGATGLAQASELVFTPQQQPAYDNLGMAS